ncbi:MAG: flagellar biosynthesis protein FlgN [Spirochaetota bacterium]
MAVTEEGPTINALNEKELQERVSILKQLKEKLIIQRQKFHAYLKVLEEEEKDILNNEAEKLKLHAEMEKGIVQEIYVFQKVIDPLAELYGLAYPHKEREIPRIQLSLEKVRQLVIERSERNQALLKMRMKQLRQEIVSIKRPFSLKSSYASTTIPVLIDITT